MISINPCEVEVKHVMITIQLHEVEIMISINSREVEVKHVIVEILISILCPVKISINLHEVACCDIINPREVEVKHVIAVSGDDTQIFGHMQIFHVEL